MTDQNRPTERIAGALVVCLPRGQSLADWRDAGTLEREWAVHKALAPRFGRVVVVSHGGPDGLTTAGELAHDPARVTIVCNESGLSQDEFTAQAVERVAAELAGCATAIVKADQMVGCDLARPITLALRKNGVDARLVARAGFHWSRFIARECGPDSAEAIEAGDDEANICELADAVVSADGHTLDDLAWRYRFDRARAMIVPDCILADADPTADRDPRRLVSVGSLVPQSRMELIIEAIAQLGDMCGEFTLEIIGDGPERASLEALAAERGVNLVVAPRSNHQDVMDAMARAGALVQAEDHVGDPRFVYEAQALGTPCIVTETQGLANAVEHGVTGLRCAQDPAAIAHMITGLCEDSSWAEALALAAARRVRARYGVDRCAAALADAYTCALAEASRAA